MDAESLQREIDQLTLHVATDSRKLKEMKVDLRAALRPVRARRKLLTDAERVTAHRERQQRWYQRNRSKVLAAKKTWYDERKIDRRCGGAPGISESE